MTYFRARYGGTSAANFDDPAAGYHHWPDPETPVEVGPLTAAHLGGHEMFAEVAPHEATSHDNTAGERFTPVTEPNPHTPNHVSTAPRVVPVEPDPAPSEPDEDDDTSDSDDDSNPDTGDESTSGEGGPRRRSRRRGATAAPSK